MTVVLEGGLGLRDVKSLHGRLCEALADRDAVTIDARGVTEADVSIVQLLIAARKSADRDGQAITFLMDPSGAVEAVLVRAGFIAPDGGDESEEELFWRGQTSVRTESSA